MKSTDNFTEDAKENEPETHAPPAPPAPPSVFPLLDPAISKRTKWLLTLRTIALINVLINMGMASSIFSVTLKDLLPRVNGNYETIVQAGSFGPLISVVGFGFGMICDKFSNWQDLVMCFALLLSSATTIAVPWTRSLLAYGINYVFFFVGFGVQNSVSNYAIMSLWGRHANGPLHFMHLGFGIGAFISPLIARPYLSPDVNNSTYVTMEPYNVTMTTRTSLLNSSEGKSEFNSQIEIPFAILGGYGILCAFTFLILQVAGQSADVHEENAKARTLISKQSCLGFFSPGNWAEGNVMFGTVMLIGMVFYYAGLIGSEGTIRYFLFSFAIESELKFSKQDAALLDSIYNLCYTVGRLIAGILSMFFPIQTLMFIELTGVLLSTSCLAFFLSSQTNLWIFACVFGFMAGPNWPAGLSWCNRYITVTASFSAWIGVSSALAKFPQDWAVGYLFENVGPAHIMNYSFAFAGFVMLNMILLQIFASRHGSKYGTKEDSSALGGAANAAFTGDENKAVDTHL